LGLFTLSPGRICEHDSLPQKMLAMRQRWLWVTRLYLSLISKASLPEERYWLTFSLMRARLPVCFKYYRVPLKLAIRF